MCDNSCTRCCGSPRIPTTRTDRAAGAALAQLQLALSRGVRYLDGGWQTLVDGLRHAAQHAGVHLETSRKVTTIEHQTTTYSVALDDGTCLQTQGVIMTGSPTEAVALVRGHTKTLMQQWATAAVRCARR